MQTSGAARRVTIISIAASLSLAVLKIVIGWMAGSTSVIADGFESAADVVASSVVLLGLVMAERPPDEDHPYGHGRLETVSGFLVGLILTAAGVAICRGSLMRAFEVHPPPRAYAAWPMLFSIAGKSVLTVWKYRTANRTGSAGLRADAFNDAVDILSGLVALTALLLTIFDPTRFLAADHFGGLGVGIIVVFLGLHLVREATMQLMDTMPDKSAMRRIRTIAESVPGALGVEKCYARKTGLQYHVDLHLEVDGALTVRESHEIAGAVRRRVKQELDWVADVLVHVEPRDRTTP